MELLTSGGTVPTVSPQHCAHARWARSPPAAPRITSLLHQLHATTFPPHSPLNCPVKATRLLQTDKSRQTPSSLDPAEGSPPPCPSPSQLTTPRAVPSRSNCLPAAIMFLSMANSATCDSVLPGRNSHLRVCPSDAGRVGLLDAERSVTGSHLLLPTLRCDTVPLLA